MNKLVSILIPAYNAEQWVRETIESALAQTWPNKEIIVVDDGSSDKTFDIAKQLESRTMKVISQDNCGASAARNKALSLAQGDYIQWLDADDLLAPDKISLQLKNDDYGSNSPILLSSAFGLFYYRRHRARFIPTTLWQDLTPVEWLIAKFGENVWMNPACWLVSRQLTEQAGLWDERLSLNDDGEYFSRVVAACDLVRFVPEAKCYYRQVNLNSISNTITHKACESMYLSIKLCFKHLLALEDSVRTRIAALKYLQTCLDYFYPEETLILEDIVVLANKLGGNITQPKLNRKYYIIMKVLGWQTAKSVEVVVHRYKKQVRSNYDKYMSIFDRL